MSFVLDPDELYSGPHSQCTVSAPERIRTTNLLIRSQMLYPVELRAQIVFLPMKGMSFVYEPCSFAHKKFRSKFRCIKFRV
jgi:hypothetical protein